MINTFLSFKPEEPQPGTSKGIDWTETPPQRPPQSQATGNSGPDRARDPPASIPEVMGNKACDLCILFISIISKLVLLLPDWF